MSSNRTDDQRLANELDLQIFRVLSRAEERASATRSPKWREAASKLRQARPSLRGMMHPADQAETSS